MIDLKLTITYEPPEPPPASGDGWPDELDWPGVRATVSLPALETTQRIPISSPSMTCCGDHLGSLWGEYETTGNPRRSRSKVFRAPTLAEAEAKARAWHDAGRSTVLLVQATRTLRLVRRAETIARAHETHGEVEAPE